jgi:2-methylcitrate dehydratase
VDETTDVIASFVHDLTWESLPATTVQHAKRRLVDSLGCAVGAIDSPPARIARGLAADVSAVRPATAIGLPGGTTPEMAAFTNTVMVRYLDFNDMYFAPIGGGGHPSDLIPTALAVGQSLGSSGPQVLTAIVAAYEVLGRLAGTVRLRERGWDQGILIVAAAAMAAGKLHGLSREELGHAVSLAIIPNIATRATRVGELSMWKGCATAGAARNGIYAALLASRGMTGPPEPFDGFDGIKQRVTGPFELEMPVKPDAFVIEQIHTKYRPAEYNAQGPLDLIIRLRDRVRLEDIERIDLETYWLAYSEIGMEPQKWDPQTRETADHSLPYMLAVALVDGDLTRESFSAERIRDPLLRPLMNRIHIAENQEHNTRFPAELPCRIAIRLTDGSEIVDEIAWPKGHLRNPVSDAEIDRKFDGLVRGKSDADTKVCEDLRAALWSFEAVAEVEAVLRPLGALHVA